MKRFCFHEEDLKKVDTKVTEFMEFDFSEYTKNENDIYELDSIIVHHGINLEKGHYTCYGYNQDSEEWYHFNDSKVTFLYGEDVLEQQPYLLFFERKTDQEKEN